MGDPLPRPEPKKEAYNQHTVELNVHQTAAFRHWLAQPNGTHRVGRVSFEAVEGGGILIKTESFKA